jgi:hypothetical protein
VPVGTPINNPLSVSLGPPKNAEYSKEIDLFAPIELVND